MVSPDVRAVGASRRAHLLTIVTLILSSYTQVLYPYVFLHVIVFLAGVPTAQTLPNGSSFGILPLHHLPRNLLIRLS